MHRRVSANSRWLLLLILGFAPRICLAQETTSAAQNTAHTHRQELSDFLGGVLAIDGAAGFDSDRPGRPTLFGGVKIGVPASLKGGYPGTLLRTVTLDLGYDRMQSRGGVSAELSMMLPMGRFPRPSTTDAKYVRVYVEPGAGYRVGGGGFGPYASTKVMLALFSNKWLTAIDAPACPFLEIQRRFPLTSPLRGDTRVVIGLMAAWCNHCGE
jgi:hypothetical protein